MASLTSDIGNGFNFQLEVVQTDSESPYFMKIALSRQSNPSRNIMVNIPMYSAVSNPECVLTPEEIANMLLKASMLFSDVADDLLFGKKA